jgi:hypothetical protein
MRIQQVSRAIKVPTLVYRVLSPLAAISFVAVVEGCRAQSKGLP